MKKVVILALCLVLSLAGGALAAEGSLGPSKSIKEDIQVSVEIGPYARIEAQRVQLDINSWNPLKWKWVDGDPGMNFGFYTGEAGYGKMSDSNCFILETNTAVKVQFEGKSLTHESSSEDKMLTRYMAWRSGFAQELPANVWKIPWQIIPIRNLGYFGEASKAPRNNGKPDVIFDLGDVKFEDLLNSVKQALTEFLNDLVWPTDDWSGNPSPTYAEDNVSTNGTYAYQVFGFVSTDEISSQRAGKYYGEITVTVSK
jgi:hypothetical protein